MRPAVLLLAVAVLGLAAVPAQGEPTRLPAGCGAACLSIPVWDRCCRRCAPRWHTAACSDTAAGGVPAGCSDRSAQPPIPSHPLLPRPPHPAAAAPTPADQRNALQLLGYALDPTGATLNWTTSGTDYCKWTGITCNSQGLVQEM